MEDPTPAAVSTMKRYSWVTLLAVNSALVVAALLMSEVLLQLGSAWSPQIDAATGGRWYAPFIRGNGIEVRGNPRHPGHDFRGFRNTGSIEKAPIVAMGSSHTYGEGASQPWPSLLSQALAKPVYNMATPSSGVSHNYQNLSIARELEPKLIVIDLAPLTYFFDFKFAENTGTLSQFASADALETIHNLEQRHNIETDDAGLFADNVPRNPMDRVVLNIKQFFKDYSRVYGLVRAIKRRMAGDDALLSRDFDQAKRDVVENRLTSVSVFDGPAWKTILNTPRRLNVINDTDVRIKTGLEVSKRMLELISRGAARSGIDFAVLLLPTKEYVFWPKVEHPERYKGLIDLVRNEERLRAEMIRFFQANAIDYIDPAPALRSSPDQPYFPDADGHPNMKGHKIIAEAVLRFIEKKGQY
jgi:hypothetical protein